MDGIDKITSRITADIDREVAEIMAEANTQATAIKTEYHARAQRESDEILARGKKNAAERQERLASVAQLEARKAELAVKQEMVEKAFHAALEKLQNLPEAEHVALLAKLATGAARTGKEQVVFSQKDRTKFGKQAVTAANEALGAKGNLTLSEEARHIEGGLVLLDGDVEVNCTFETLLRMQRNNLSLEVANLLFNEKG
ncbi:MAG: hypothetical protein LIO58_09255 [Oscillospiraceae bacterium]|nr:hypothetical protein [Oscillospiraceae bacterium]